MQSPFIDYEQYEKAFRDESIKNVLSDYKAAIHSITDAFNDRLSKYDVKLKLKLDVNIVQATKKEERNYGQEYRTDLQEYGQKYRTDI